MSGSPRMSTQLWLRGRVQPPCAFPERWFGGAHAFSQHGFGIRCAGGRACDSYIAYSVTSTRKDRDFAMYITDTLPPSPGCDNIFVSGSNIGYVHLILLDEEAHK
jgi:hypothetical protein